MKDILIVLVLSLIGFIISGIVLNLSIETIFFSTILFFIIAITLIPFIMVVIDKIKEQK